MKLKRIIINVQEYHKHRKSTYGFENYKQRKGTNQAELTHPFFLILETRCTFAFLFYLLALLKASLLIEVVIYIMVVTPPPFPAPER